MRASLSSGASHNEVVAAVDINVRKRDLGRKAARLRRNRTTLSGIGDGIGDPPTTWDPIISKNQADVPAQSSKSSPLGEDLFCGATETSSDHTEVQLLTNELTLWKKKTITQVLQKDRWLSRRQKKALQRKKNAPR